MISKKKKFSLFGESWVIKWVDSIEPDENGNYVFGRTDLTNHVILVNTKNCEDKDLSEETIHTTLLHELVHAIFGSGQYLASTTDEPLVEWTARCLNSLGKQKII